MSLDNDRADVVRAHVTEVVGEIEPRLRGWLPAGTAPLSFLAMLAMLIVADDASARAGIAVFMVSALILFTTSAIYHLRTWSLRRQQALERLDHAIIYVLMAGSSTPFALMLLSPRSAVDMLVLVWGGAVLGVAWEVFWSDAPRRLHIPLYLVLGGGPVLFLGEFLAAGQAVALSLAGAGGVLYSLGAMVYALRWPNPSPAYCGFHEVFHTLTIVAFTVHCVAISTLIRG